MTFTSLAALFLWTIIYCTTDIEEEWDSFKKLYNKSYDPKEEPQRKLNFLENLKKIQKHNVEESFGLHTYKLGINFLADMSEYEFETMYRSDSKRETQEIEDSSKEQLEESSKNKTEDTEDPSIIDSAHIMPKNDSLCNISQLGSPPSSRDWRDSGYDSPADNQGTKCGSCWAFSTVAAVEAHYFLKTGRNVKLSTQNLVDCVKHFSICHIFNSSCSGGSLHCAHAFIRGVGINLARNYPYEAKDGPCRFNGEKEVITISDFCETRSDQELRVAVGNIGPVAVAIKIGAFSSMFYRSGVYSGECHPQYFWHGVVLFGYGSENGQDYWLMKNSFGSLWGDNGYIKIARNYNTCGIAIIYGVYPII